MNTIINVPAPIIVRTTTIIAAIRVMLLEEEGSLVGVVFRVVLEEKRFVGESAAEVRWLVSGTIVDGVHESIHRITIIFVINIS